MYKTTALFDIHKSLNAKIVPFAGYDMPLYYPEMGALKEHLWVRNNVGIFDVSHMGQLFVNGGDAKKFLSLITPSDFDDVSLGGAKYTVLTNENGGIIDDLIVTKFGEDKFFLVINAGCKEKDINWIKTNQKKFAGVTLDLLEDRVLIAVQGGDVENILSELFGSQVKEISYMNAKIFDIPSWIGVEAGQFAILSRTGYTGEDGFEISIANKFANKLWNKLLSFAQVKPIGLAARDSLRLEMGYPLYGHDLTEEITVIESGLKWVIGKNNNSYIGRGVIEKQIANDTDKKRVGIMLEEKAIAREGSKVFDENDNEIGYLTSGAFSPSLNISIGQAYIKNDKNIDKNKIFVEVRNKKVKGKICSPFFLKAKVKK